MANLNKNARYEFLSVVEKMSHKAQGVETRGNDKNKKAIRKARREHSRNN